MTKLSVSAIVLMLVLSGCSGGGGNDNVNRNSNINNNSNDNGVDRDNGNEDDQATPASVPRSLGGDISEADAFGVDREMLDNDRQVTQLIDIDDRRDAAELSLSFLKGVLTRFRISLDVAKRIEASQITLLDDQIQTADVQVTTDDNEDICLRLSSAAFAPDDSSDEEGGAPLAADLSVSDQPISLRIWANEQCTDDDEDFSRFYASIIEQRPEDQDSLNDDDNSSELAWRAGKGRAWLIPSALLDVDPNYRASAEWDHTDELLRTTTLFESGRIADDVVIESARYVAIRELTEDDLGRDLLCKKIHATVTFSEHPSLTEADIRLGLCVLQEDEGDLSDRLRISGTIQRIGDVFPTSLDEACFAADDDVSSDCGEFIDPPTLNLTDALLIDEPVDDEESALPDSSFMEQPPSAADGQILDLRPVDGTLKVRTP